MVTDSEDLDGLIAEGMARANATGGADRIEALAMVGAFVVARELRRLRKEMAAHPERAGEAAKGLAR